MVPDAAYIADEDAGIRGCQTSLPFWPRWSPKAIGQRTREEACRAEEQDGGEKLTPIKGQWEDQYKLKGMETLKHEVSMSRR